MEKLVPKVWVLAPWDDQDGRYFKGGCPDLDLKGRLTADTVVEIMPLETNPYHNGIFVEKPFWYEGPEVSYSPRRLFFDQLGFSVKRKRDLYDHTIMTILYGVTEKHLGTKTLAIIFPYEVMFEDDEAQDIIHTIQKSFVMDCQTPKGRPNENLSCIERVYLIVPNTKDNGKACHQLMGALVKASEPA